MPTHTTSRTRIGVDTETYPTANGRKAPRLVCVSFAGRGEAPKFFQAMAKNDPTQANVILDQAGDFWRMLCSWKHGIHAYDFILCREEYELLIHNAMFDMAVLDANCHTRMDMSLTEDNMLALEAGRVRCSMVREKLITNAWGRCTTESDSNPPLDWRVPTRPDGKKKTVGNALHDVMWVYHRVDISHSKKGEDVWRKRYHELEGLPLRDWPTDAREYAMQDAVYHVMAFEGQDEFCPGEVKGMPFRRADSWLPHEKDRTMYSYDLELVAGWGRRTHEQRVSDWFDVTNDAITKAQALADKAGFLKPLAKHGGCKGQGCAACNDTGMARGVTLKPLRALIKADYERRRMPVPMTTRPKKQSPSAYEKWKPAVKYDKDTLMACSNPVLVAWGEASIHRINLSKFGDPLRMGVHHAKTWSVNPMVATGRISIWGPPEQQPPKIGGYRECHEPRGGTAYISCDWSAAEMRCWAQICVWMGWDSPMARAFEKGMCTHSLFGSQLIGMDYEEFQRARKDPSHPMHALAVIARQFAKIPNFGLLGGMGVKRFVGECHKAGFPVDPDMWVVCRVEGKKVELVQVCEDESQARRTAADVTGSFALASGRDIIKMWKNQWNAWSYFKWIGSQGDSFMYAHWGTGMLRGDVNYTNGANTGFQNLTGVFSLSALHRINRECFTPYTTGLNGSLVRGASPLYGCRAVLPLHDEHILEVPLDRLTEVGERLAQIMVQEAARHHPNVPAEVEWEAMGVWSKKATQMRDESGRVVPWYPEGDPRRVGEAA